MGGDSSEDEIGGTISKYMCMYIDICKLYFILFYFIYLFIERMPKGKERVSYLFYCVYYNN